MQITEKNIETVAVVGKFTPTSCRIRFDSTINSSVSISPLNFLIISKKQQKESLMRIKHRVSKQIHAISDNLRTCVANFSTEHCEILALANGGVFNL